MLSNFIFTENNLNFPLIYWPISLNIGVWLKLTRADEEHSEYVPTELYPFTC